MDPLFLKSALADVMVCSKNMNPKRTRRKKEARNPRIVFPGEGGTPDCPRAQVACMLKKLKKKKEMNLGILKVKTLLCDVE